MNILGSPVKKQTVYLAGGILLVVGGIAYYRSRQSTSAAASTAASTTAANNIDPATGYAYGSQEDQAALAGMAGTGSSDSASYVGGQIIGYDQYGNPIYGSGENGGGSGGVPGGFTNNAQWAQAAEQYMGSTGADSIAAALGKYITGQTVTADQTTIIQEAIAAEGYPPVAGTDGYPPSLRTVATAPAPINGQITVPNVKGMKGEDAVKTIQDLGLVSQQSPQVPKGKSSVVISQSPAEGKKVNKGAVVTTKLRVS